ncbi:MAG: CRISPR-associated endonuclease Cas2 [Clostridiales bacterium]|nr:CRISPR-associated endonuclease Cas2 [Clostridiales bacterium]
MRLLVFFDLPMQTDKDKREYTQFRKFLQMNGFIMMQQSVYSKLVVNNVTSDLMRHKIKGHIPARGLVQMLTITENQFSKIEYLVGQEQQATLDGLDRLVEI